MTEEALALARGVTDDGPMNTSRAWGGTRGGHGRGEHMPILFVYLFPLCLCWDWLINCDNRFIIFIFIGKLCRKIHNRNPSLHRLIPSLFESYMLFALFFHIIIIMKLAQQITWNKEHNFYYIHQSRSLFVAITFGNSSCLWKGLWTFQMPTQFFSRSTSI